MSSTAAHAAGPSGKADAPARRELLPSRVTLQRDESLDGFLERLARANGLRSRQLLRVLASLAGPSIPTTAFLMFEVDPAFLDRLARISGVCPEELQNATLARFGGGLPLQLDGLNPRERTSFRQVVMQGWFPQFGSAICPECLASDGLWQLAWRLPIIAACVRHRVLLTPRCAGCGKRFRTHRYATLRPILSAAEPCGNSLGLRTHCHHPVTAHSSQPAGPEVLAATCAIQQAIEGCPTKMLGSTTDARVYLAELRHVATLLLHLLSRSGGESAVAWGEELHREAATRTTSRRGPRWGITPPGSAAARGGALAEAHNILSQDNVQAAGDRLAGWLWLIEDHNGPAVWLKQRTTQTTTTTQIIDAAVAPRRHVGRRLRAVSDGGRSLLPAAIPQLFDAALYAELFEGMLGGYEVTGRMYVSLCVVRLVSPATNWSEAAFQLNLDPDIGRRTARAASNRMRVTPAALEEAVRQAHRALPRGRDFRVRESRVRALAANPVAWEDCWRDTTSPRRRSTSLPYAVTWMWCEVAQGTLDTSPAWAEGPTPPAKVAYRAFRDKLPEASKDFLRALVLTDAMS
ncbi:TniQ family protein [Mycolicibacterium baixiangningiae]|uniref:TniQ family protein n=1 Tax=Mycolicibacterium baixiangningiae TaxID=2761578 RepID=UPI001868BF30|nr:TniQ family protein [Mycolicibacterium baixiangningiae]